MFKVIKISNTLKCYIFLKFLPFSKTLELIKYSKKLKKYLQISKEYYYFPCNFSKNKHCIPHLLLSEIKSKNPFISKNEIEKRVIEFTKVISKRFYIEVDFKHIFDRTIFYEIDNNIIVHITELTDSLKYFLIPIMAQKVLRDKIISIKFDSVEKSILNFLYLENINTLEINGNCNENYVVELLNIFKQRYFNLKNFVILVKLKSPYFIGNFLKKTINLEKIILRFPFFENLDFMIHEFNNLSHLKKIDIIIEFKQIESFFRSQFPFEKLKKLSILIDLEDNLYNLIVPKNLKNLKYLEIISKKNIMDLNFLSDFQDKNKYMKVLKKEQLFCK